MTLAPAKPRGEYSAADQKIFQLLDESGDTALSGNMQHDAHVVRAAVQSGDAFAPESPSAIALQNIREAINTYGFGTSLALIENAASARQIWRQRMQPQVIHATPRKDQPPAPCPDCRFGFAGEVPRSFDPLQCNLWQSAQIIVNCFENLLMPTGPNGYELAAAETMKISADGRTYTFTLRDAHWSDGSPVTADDFAFAWRRVLDPNNASQVAPRLYIIENAEKNFKGNHSQPLGITVLNARTIQVRLENASPLFPYLMTDQSFAPVPRAVVERYGKEWTRMEHIVTNGPYVPTRYQDHVDVELKKNPHYREEQFVQIERVRVRECKEETAVQFYEMRDRGGDIDWVPMLPPALVKHYADRPDFRRQSELGNYFIVLNTKKPQFGDVAVRKNLSAAIPRREIAAVTSMGHQAKYHFPMQFKEMPIYTSIFTALDGYGVMTNELGARAWFGNHPLTFTYLFDNNNLQQTIAELLKEKMESFGVTVELDLKEHGTMRDMGRAHEFVAHRDGWSADYPDPLNFLQMYVTGDSNNDSNYSNPAYDALYHQADIATNMEARNQIIVQMEKILLRDMPAIPVLDVESPSLVSPDFKVVSINISTLPIIKDMRR